MLTVEKFGINHEVFMLRGFLYYLCDAQHQAGDKLLKTIWEFLV